MNRQIFVMENTRDISASVCIVALPLRPVPLRWNGRGGEAMNQPHYDEKEKHHDLHF